MSVPHFHRWFFSQQGLVVFVSLLGLGILSSCGGGGSSRSQPPPTPAPNPPPPPATVVITSLDSIPSANITGVDPGFSEISVATTAIAGLSISYTGSCVSGITLERSLVDVSDPAINGVYDNKLRCDTLLPGTDVSVGVDYQRNSESPITVSNSFSTAAAITQPKFLTEETVMSTQAVVEQMFSDYVSGQLLTELNLSAALELLLANEITALAANHWQNLSQPNSLYSVASTRVSYASRNPAGQAATNLTGLVAHPDPNSPFSRRDEIILLAHSTGSTPADLAPANAWYIAANLFAARGYLVIAADNWGRGGTTTDSETYLMSNRTGLNNLDLLNALVADPFYQQFFDAQAAPKVTLIGYSQGGHSVMAIWQAIAAYAGDRFTVGKVFSGGAPHNLYETFKGVLKHVDGSCDNDEYCRYVDAESTVPFATKRILPGFLDYTDLDLDMADLVVGDEFTASFVAGFLANQPAFDKLKAVLQLSSFTNVADYSSLTQPSATEFQFYHSDFDRLVPAQNTLELVNLLDGQAQVTFDRTVCNSSGFESIFLATDFVGIVHTLCGLSMLDIALTELQ